MAKILNNRDRRPVAKPVSDTKRKKNNPQPQQAQPARSGRTADRD